MPVDREHWFRQLDLSNFVNAYYQFRDLSRIEGCRRVLIVGPGQGLQTEVLRWRGYEVTTLDIDETFKPDVIGSVHDMNMFEDRQFDAVIASHVLEHLAVAYLDGSLCELSRVAAYALIYLPVAGRHVQAREQPGSNGIDARYCGGQHFWEVGMRGFRVKDLKRRMSSEFEVVDVYRNRDWNPSLNFVLRSKRAVPR
jgi:hypothetical protein